GHIKRDCHQYKEAQKLKVEYKIYKKNKTTLLENSELYNSTDININNNTISVQILENNHENEQEQLIQEKISLLQKEPITQNNTTNIQQEVFSDLNISDIDNHMTDLDTLLQEKKNQENSIIANNTTDNIQQ
ncbi:27573_t:CDS:1, partial [Racocetra persica]